MSGAPRVPESRRRERSLPPTSNVALDNPIRPPKKRSGTRPPRATRTCADRLARPKRVETECPPRFGFRCLLLATLVKIPDAICHLLVPVPRGKWARPKGKPTLAEYMKLAGDDSDSESEDESSSEADDSSDEKARVVS